MSLSSLSDSQVINHCREERQQPRRQAPKELSSCLELLRRAFVVWSSQAFEAAHEFYHLEFIAWVVKSQKYEDLRLFKPHITADDIVQNTYIKLHRALKKQDNFYTKFKSLPYFMAYCRTTTANCIRDYLPRKVKSVNQTDANPGSYALPINLPADRENLIVDAQNNRDRVEGEMNWKNLLDYANSLLQADEQEVLAYKVFGAPTLEDMLHAGKTYDDIKRLWRRVLIKLKHNEALRQML